MAVKKNKRPEQAGRAQPIEKINEPTREEILSALSDYVEHYKKNPHVTPPWQSLATTAPLLWSYLPSRCAMEAATKATISDENRARATAISHFVGHSPLEAATFLLSIEHIGRSLERDNRTDPEKLAHTFLVAWLVHASKGNVRPPRADPVRTFRLGIACCFPKIFQRLERVADHAILAAIELWAGNPKGRPRKGSRPSKKTKWQRLEAFVREQVGINMMTGESLRQASIYGGTYYEPAHSSDEQWAERILEDSMPYLASNVPDNVGAFIRVSYGNCTLIALKSEEGVVVERASPRTRREELFQTGMRAFLPPMLSAPPGKSRASRVQQSTVVVGDIVTAWERWVLVSDSHSDDPYRNILAAPPRKL